MPRPRRTIILKDLPTEETFPNLAQVLEAVYQLPAHEASLRARRSYGIVAMDERPDLVEAVEAALLDAGLEAYNLPAEWVPSEPETYLPCALALFSDDGLSYATDSTGYPLKKVTWPDVGALTVGAVLFEEIRGLGQVKPGSFLGSVGAHVAEIGSAINPSATSVLKAKLGPEKFDRALSLERLRERGRRGDDEKRFQEVAALRLRNPEVGLYIYPKGFAVPDVDPHNELPPRERLRRFLSRITPQVPPIGIGAGLSAFLDDAAEAFPAYHSPALFQRSLRWHIISRIVQESLG